MKRMSLQWRLTCIITLYIALICGCLTLLVYKNGVYYMILCKKPLMPREMIMGAVLMKYISVFRRISGMNLQMTFLLRCTIIRQITRKTA